MMLFLYMKSAYKRAKPVDRQPTLYQHSISIHSIICLLLAIKVILLISMTLGCSFGQDTPASSAPNLVKTFRSFDKNGDNILSKREFKKGMIALKKNLGENERLSRSDINQVFNSLDDSPETRLHTHNIFSL